jgi:probable rRNA maturation factor
VNIFFGNEQNELVDEAALRRFAQVILEAECFPGGTEMAVILVDVDQMVEYNRRFMDRDGPTDVLSFPLADLEPGAVPVPVANEPPLVLGDVFLCPSEIGRHAAAEGMDFEGFLFLLLAHGILHLLGYGHDDDDSAETMEERERELLALDGRKLP